MNPHIRRLLTPGPAEILRASQKDSGYSRKLANEMQETLQRLFGQRVSQKWYRYFMPLSSTLYHSLTSVAGYQTLGEEYTGILQVDQSGGATPKKMMVIGSVVLMIFGQRALEISLEAFSKYAKQQSSTVSDVDATETTPATDSSQPTIVMKIQEALQIFKHYTSFMFQMHLALFYLQGTFYHVSKRLLGIHYILVRRSFASHDSASRRILKYLMWISIINSFLVGVKDSISYARSLKKPTHSMGDAVHNTTTENDGGETASSSDLAKRCTLCLEVRKNPSVTQCGHIFCWCCIMDWLRTKHECPICREHFSPSRVVPLQNFS